MNGLRQAQDDGWCSVCGSFFFFQAEDGIRDLIVTGVQTCALPIWIELLDVRLRRVNYNPDVLDRIYQRMISERRQIAQRFRSEGEGEAARIAGQKERDLNEIQSTAYRRVQEIRGEAEAKATEIYARAYTQNPQAAEFYGFLKSMETYRKVLTKDSTLILSTDSDLFNLLKRSGAKPGGPPLAPSR